MRLKVLVFLSVVACLGVTLAVFAQDPLTGTWSGDWGPNPGDRNEVTLVLKWDGKALTGNVTGGTNVSSPIPLQKTSFDEKTGTVHLEADSKDRRGQTVRFIIDGKVDKGAMTGSWNHDSRRGDFKINKK
jgi:hypothetical protein